MFGLKQISEYKRFGIEYTVSLSHHPASMYEIWKLYVENYPSHCVRTKMLTKLCCNLDLWSLDPKMYRYLPLATLHLCMKYGSCMLNTTQVTQVIVSEPKWWQSSVVTLTFDLWTPKCIGIFLLPSCIYVWKLNVEKYPSYCVRTEVLTKFCCDLDLWPFDPKNVYTSSSHHPASMYEIWKLFVEN